jgi:hypothetical protein
MHSELARRPTCLRDHYRHRNEYCQSPATSHPPTITSTARPPFSRRFRLLLVTRNFSATFHPRHFKSCLLPISANGVRFTAHIYTTSLPATCYPLPATRYTLHASRYPLHATRFTRHATRFMLHPICYPLPALAPLRLCPPTASRFSCSRTHVRTRTRYRTFALASTRGANGCLLPHPCLQLRT